jgi:hypothetical protein
MYCRITDCKLQHVCRSTVVSWWEIIACLQQGRAHNLCCRPLDGIIAIGCIWSVATPVLVVRCAGVTFTPFVTDCFIARRFILRPNEARHSSTRSMLNCFFILSPHFTENKPVSCQRAGTSHRTDPGYSGCYGKQSVNRSHTHTHQIWLHAELRWKLWCHSAPSFRKNYQRKWPDFVGHSYMRCASICCCWLVLTEGRRSASSVCWA